MIIILKETLFEILEELAPNEIISIYLPCGSHINLVRPDSVFPVATSIVEKVMSDNFDSLRSAYNSFVPSVFNDNKYETEYELNHTIKYNNRDYIITEEIINIEYFDSYIKVGESDPTGIFYKYVPYDKIDSICYTEKRANNTLKEYNSIIYMMAKNKLN